MKDLEKHYQVALQEIGPIEPWWSEDSRMFVFEHELYPGVMYADPDREKAITSYQRALKGWIADRLAGQVAPFVEKITRGRGGLRPGAGRPPGTRKESTQQIRLPVDIAAWLKSDPTHLEEVRKLMNG